MRILTDIAVAYAVIAVVEVAWFLIGYPRFCRDHRDDFEIWLPDEDARLAGRK